MMADMILDMNLFEPKKPFPDHFLTVIEQIPGFVAMEDKTQVLGNLKQIKKNKHKK